MTKVLRRLAVLVILGLAGGLVYWYVATHYENAKDGSLRVSGNIEVTEVQISFKIPGRVEERLVDEGDLVKQNETIARLETADLQNELALRQAELHAANAALDELLAGSRQEEIASSKAALQKAEATLKDLESGSRPQEIAAAEATLEAAVADEHQTNQTFDRSSQLFHRGAITAEQYDKDRATRDIAFQKRVQAEEQLKLSREGFRAGQIEEAKAALKQAKAQCDLVVAGPRKEVIDQARAKVEQAKASLLLAETKLGYATIASPLNGVVLSKNIEPGEYVVAGTPVVTVGDLVNVWLRAYIEEPDLDRVKVGQKAMITTDGGNSFEGHVSFISSAAEFTPKNVQTQKERVKLVYRIKIDVVCPDMKLKPGMPADAVIEAK